jgi:glutathione S-transferase
MRYWNKFVDEQVMNYVSMHGWHRLVRVIANSIEGGKFEELMSHVPLPDQRKKWMTARSGFEQKDLDHALEKIEYALDKIEKQLGETAYLAGDTYTLADINFYSHCGMSVNRMFPQFDVDDHYPNLVRWRESVSDRPAVQEALAGEDRTQPGLRTWGGDGREHS